MKLLKLLGIVLLGMLVVVQVSNAAGIRSSKHDLSSSSTTTGPKSNLDDVCIFCHTPHSNQTSTVLWNRNASSATYTVYSSSTMEQTVPQPGGASKQCLSCHDGTVAFNSLVNNAGTGAGTPPTVTPSTIANANLDSLGIDMSNDHPVSLIYSTSQATDSYLRAASLVNSKPVVSNAGTTVPLYGTSTANGTLECASCHDPHLTTNGTFLRVANTASQLCFACHNK